MLTKDELLRLEQPALIKLIDSGELAPVVRCKDCIYRLTRTCGMYCDECKGEWTLDEDYCSFGAEMDAKEGTE